MGTASLTDRLRRGALALGGIVAAGVVGTIICKAASSRWVPPAAFGQAVVNGALSAMFAIGLVLIYRAGRIVNFSQGSLGVMGSSLFLMLMLVEEWSFWAALPVAVGVAGATGFIVELLVVRRLSRAPRLALTVVTIGLSQILLAFSGLLPMLFLGPDEAVTEAQLVTPFSRFEWRWSPLVFTGDHVTVVVVALIVMVGLAAFFRFTSVGIAVRAAAENEERTSHLGINVNNLSTLVWVMAATLSGLAAVLTLTVQPNILGIAAVGATSAGIMLRALAAAVVGRMDNLPVTVAAAIGISVFEQSMFWAFDQTSITDLALLILIVGLLLIQRARASRSEESQTGSWAASTEIRPIPTELRGLLQVRRGVRRVLVVVGAMVLAFPWVMSPSQTSLGTVYVIYGIIVVSLVVLTGWGGQISLGQFAFVAVGAVFGGALTMRWGWPFLLALPVASLIGAGVAVLVGLPALRIRGLFLAVTTLAFAVATSNVFLNARYLRWILPEGDIPRPKLLFLNMEDQRVYFYFCVAGLGFAVWVAQGIRNSRAGRVLIAMRDNERTAQAFSINLIRTRLVTFAISGFLASFAGVLLSHQQHSVRSTAFAPEQSIQIFLVAVIGGLGSVSGSLLGALYFGIVNVVIANAFGRLLASGLGVMFILLFFPGGLAGLVFGVRDAWLRRVAMRSRIFVPSLVGDYRVLEGEHTRVTLAPLSTNGEGKDGEVPVKYRIPSVIGVRGESQQGRGWRWE